jgi:hypothetical protein
MDDRSDGMSTPEATGLTIADLEAMPDDMVIRNLIDGELFVTPAPLEGFSVAVAALLAG